VAWLAGWKEGAPALLWAFALLLWGAGGAVALRSGPAAWPQLPRAARWVLGLAALWLAWLA
jgi:phosphatidate cytidylyltransferase